MTHEKGRLDVKINVDTISPEELCSLFLGQHIWTIDKENMIVQWSIVTMHLPHEGSVEISARRNFDTGSYQMDCFYTDYNSAMIESLECTLREMELELEPLQVKVDSINAKKADLMKQIEGLKDQRAGQTC